MKTCFKTTDNNTAQITLEQHVEAGLFRVTYGLQVRDNLTYSEAASELGSCIMHAAACDGLLNNEGA